MSRWQLTLRAAPPVRVDARGLLPVALEGLDADAVTRHPLGLGRERVALGELFTVTPLSGEDGPDLHLQGDLRHFDHLGAGLAEGRLRIDGNVGHRLGAAMSGGQLEVRGDAGDGVACEMRGGALVVHGRVGDEAAGALPGSMDGMRGGTLVVHGAAGERLADRMRRGTVIVFGPVGAFAASRMVAGTLALGDAVGPHLGWGMRRGSIVLAGGLPPDFPEPTFVPAGAEAPVFWQLLARDLQATGGPFAGLSTRRIERHLGDLAVDGKGEIITPLRS